MRIRILFAVITAALAAAVAFGQQSAPPKAYLPGDRAPDTTTAIPPAPQPGSPRDAADRAIFRATRALVGGPRWALATADNAGLVPDMERDFSCAVNAQLAPATAPRLTALMRRVGVDVGVATNRPKDFFKRPRPYLVDEGETCIAKTADLAQSPDYPSGHAAWGWTWGLILAELYPDRQKEILARARAYGESRVVCGVHTASAVDAGRTNASALVAALHADSAFKRDLGAARAEARGLARRVIPPGGAACAAEAGLTAGTPW